LAVITEGLKADIKISNEDKKVTIYQLSVISSDEYFSWKMTNLLIEEASKLYLDLKVGKMKSYLEVLQQRVDSVQRMLNGSMLTAAVEMDRSLGLVSQASKVNSTKMQMSAQMLGILYGELTKNLEMTKFALSQQEPLFEIIDPSLMPLTKIGRGRVKFGFIGGFIAGSILVFYLFVRKLFS
jgi:paraquat-inducible protein B